jgi:CheY-like chemotaxis protein
LLKSGSLEFPKDETITEILSGLKILIVDDALMIRKMVHRVLSQKGATCFLAGDGTEAVEAVEVLNDGIDLFSDNVVRDTATNPLKTFDVILMDSVMPSLGLWNIS